MTLSEQIAEKEKIGLDLLAEDLGLNSIRFIIENTDPEELQAYADDNSIEVEINFENKLTIIAKTRTSQIDIFLYSFPVKRTITYERI